MKKTFTLLALLLSVFSIYAQDPNILWQRTIGGSELEEPTFISGTNDGGFIVGGFSESDISGEKTENSRGGYDYWVLKFGSSGNIEWQKTIGSSQDDYLADAKQTPEGDYILLGGSDSDISGDKTENSLGYTDYWVIKLDSTGNIIWENTIGGDGYDNAAEVQITADGGYIIGGTSESGISGDRTVFNSSGRDAWVLKLDENGNILWQRSHNLMDSFSMGSIKVTADGGYIIGGTSRSPDFYSFMKVNASGNNVWEKYYGADGWQALTNLIITSDGGYLGVGFSDADASGDKTEDSQGGLDYWLLKLNSNGNIEWQNTIGGDSGDAPYTATETADGGYFITGYSYSNISGDKTENTFDSPDFWIIKLNSLGIIEWQNNIGGTNVDRLPNTVLYNDGNFIICGQSASNISGDKTENSRGGYDFWIIKHAATLGLEENPFAAAINLHPNPTTNTLQLNTQDKIINQINIYSMTGSKVLQLDINTVSPTVDVSSLASGVYYIQLYSGKNVALKKFVKE
ncbi:T9SS type A sorting domain-containing protein [Aequorivita capsosiphonis]|uniref:T9SS type A sorting domain-containing protein n=1 Tax=Aequorivita capsosiphonis TaxID=487317 RepID=UPI000423985C|nr:T9SS type A sorting domain-containing protein [Aequorivita capsosiphonis]